MNQYRTIGSMAMLMLLLSACASDTVKQGVYDALNQKQCMDQSGKPHCDPEPKSYDQYKKEREELLKPAA